MPMEELQSTRIYGQSENMINRRTLESPKYNNNSIFRNFLNEARDAGYVEIFYA